MGRLAGSLSELRSTYDVVVVGTGYGGGAAACRLARAGLDVAVLERGKELRPGDFPETAAAAAAPMQLQRGDRRRLGSATALLDWRVSRDVVALVGCGVGGTSLINANVSVEPEPEIFDDPRWPSALRGVRVEPLLQAGYARAKAMLRPTTYPEFPAQPLPKLDALRRAGRGSGAATKRLLINVTFEPTTHSTGSACMSCGVFPGVGPCCLLCQAEADPVAACLRCPLISVPSP